LEDLDKVTALDYLWSADISTSLRRIELAFVCDRVPVFKQSFQLGAFKLLRLAGSNNVLETALTLVAVQRSFIATRVANV
jgi:hypothetical protein